MKRVAHHRAVADANRQKAVWARTQLSTDAGGGGDAPAKPDPEAFSKEKIGVRARERAREILVARRQKEQLLADKKELILKRWTIERKGSLYAILSPQKRHRCRSEAGALNVLYDAYGADVIFQLLESTDSLLIEESE